MPAAPYPENEAHRLAALRSYEVLDTACEATFDNIAYLAASMLDCPMSTVTLIDSDRQWFKAGIGTEATGSARGEALCSHAILDPQQALIVPDASADARFADSPLVAGEGGVRFYAGVPLVNPEGAALGTLCVLDKIPRQINETQVAALRRLAETVMTTLELRRAMIRVREFALLDALTGIANRPALMAALDRAIATLRRQGTPFILAYIDLDGFKAVNDRLGHAAGDEVLRQVALTLAGSVRAGDIAARLGGDEFAVVMAGTSAETEHAGDRLRCAIAALQQPVTASVGAVCFDMSPASADAALGIVDQLMYAAKAAGRNRVSCGEASVLPLH